MAKTRTQWKNETGESDNMMGNKGKQAKRRRNGQKDNIMGK